VHRIRKSSGGYTLVETLVAGAILMGVLVPATMFLGRVTAGQKTRSLIIASNLAQETMERTLAAGVFENETMEVASGGRTWMIQKKIGSMNGLVTVNVSVFSGRGDTPLAVLTTMRYNENHE